MPTKIPVYSLYQVWLLWNPDCQEPISVDALKVENELYARDINGAWWRLSDIGRTYWRAPVLKIGKDRTKQFSKAYDHLIGPGHSPL